jgi:hypothetical protein
MKQKNIKTHRILAIVLLLGLGLMGSSSVASNVKAQSTSGDYTVLAPLPCIEGGGITCTTGGNGAVQPTVNFKTYVQYTINLLIGLSAVVAVVMIVWGGVEYMYTASFSGKKMGLEKVTHAIYGLVLVLTSYIILRTIDPRLVEIPNTIVPTIEIRDVLRQDATGLLLNQVLSDAAKADIKSVEIGKEIANKKKTLVEKQAELSEINNKIGSLDLENPGAEQEYQELKISKKKIEEEIRQAKIEETIVVAKLTFNSMIKNTYEDLSTETNAGYELTFAEAMKALDTNKSGVISTRDKAIKDLAKLGNVDMTAINNEAYYAMLTVDLNKIYVSISSAQNSSSLGVYQNSGPSYVGIGYGGKTTTLVTGTTQLVKTDGRAEQFRSQDAARQYLMGELETIKASKSTIKDEKLQLNLQQQIDEAVKRINTNNMLGGK